MNRDITVQTFTLWGQLLTCFLSSSKGCDLIVDGRGKYAYIDKTTLMISGVDTEDNGSYTCTLTFTLGGITGSVSETIDAWVRGKRGLGSATWYFTLLVHHIVL